MTPLSAQCHCGASIGVPCRPDGGTCRHRGAVLVTRPCVVCDGDRHAVDGAMHECVRCGARSWPAVDVPETPAQAEQRARLSNPVGDRMIALFRSLAGEFGVAPDPPRVGEEE